jgi:hypothetical protein
MLNRSCSTISRGLEELYDVVNGEVCLVDSGFEFAVGLKVGVGAVVKQAIGERSV